MIKNMVRFLAFVCCVGFAMSAWGDYYYLGLAQNTSIGGSAVNGEVKSLMDISDLDNSAFNKEGWQGSFTKVVIRTVEAGTAKNAIVFGTGTELAAVSSSGGAASQTITLALTEGQYSSITAENIQNSYFCVEFYNGAQVVAFSDVYQVSALQEALLKSSDGRGPQNMFVMTVTPMPEPTSGLLFLVGGALLGLRRKRRAA